MKEWWKKHKNEVYVGIISCFLTSLIFAFIRWIVSSGPMVGGSILSALVNSIYKSAGRSSYFSIINSFYLFVCIFSLGGVVYVAISVFSTVHKTMLALDLEDKIGSVEQDEKITSEQIEELKRDLKKVTDANVKKEPSLRKRTKQLRLSAIMTIICFIVSISLTVFYTMVPIYMRNNFDLSLTQIAPYVEEQELLNVKSKWVSMETREDYQEIIEYIDNVKTENGLTP